MLGMLLLFSVPTFGQGIRFGDQQPVQSAQTPGGPIYSVPNATINFCNSPANGVPCTNKITTYTDITLTTACPTSTQVVLSGTNSCVASTDQYGNWGVWISPGVYTFTIQVASGAAIGPYTVTISGGGGSILPTINNWLALNNFTAGATVFGLPIGGFEGTPVLGDCVNIYQVSPLAFGDAGVACGGGGGGGSPAGNNGDIQIRSGGSFGTGGPGGSTANVGVLGNIAVKNFSTDGVCYASTNGNDSNDGLSWGTAKLTIRGCAVSLPGGSTSPDTTGKGTIYFTDQTSAHPTSGCGLWLMGSTDPNYASPPTCWIKNPGSATGLTLIGVAQGSYGTGPTLSKARLLGGNAADINHPCLWISGIDTQMVFQNLQCNFQGRPIVIGEDSNHSRAGVTGGSSGITFINVGSSPNTLSGQGPAWDIVGGSFWLNFSYCYGQGTDAVNTPTNNNAAAFLFDGTGNDGIGEIYLDHISVAGGGIKVNPGTVNPSVQMFEADHIEGESLHAPALVWFTGQMGAVGVHDAVANDSIGTLCNGGVCAVENDGTLPDNVSIGGALLGSSLPPTKGPMIEVGGLFDLVGQPGVTASFLRQGLRGVIGSHLIGTSDVSRRQLGPTSVRFVNSALSPASYIVIAGTTLTQNVADPSGGTSATRLTATGPGEGVYIASQSGVTANVGDWFVFGAWVHSFTANGYATSGNPISIGLSSCTNTQTTYNFGGNTPSPPYGGDGQWDWIVAAVQIATVSGGACQPNITVSADATHTLDLYSPVYFHVPVASAPSANEMLEIANNLQSYDSSCAVGTQCTATGTFNFGGSGGLKASSMTDSGLTNGNCVQAGTGGLLGTVSGPCSTGGTVTSVGTVAPLSGTVTTTGNLSCPTCVTASSPGAGIAHFAGSTQAVTSSAVNLASSDVTGLTPIANGGTGTSSPALVAGTNVTITGSWPNQTINSSGGGGGSVGPGTTNGIAYFNASSTVTSPTPPSVNGQYIFGYNVIGGVSVPPTSTLVGLTGGTIAGGSTSYITATADNSTVITHLVGGTASATLTLSTPATVLNANPVYSYSNHSSHTDTIAPAGGFTIQSGSSAAASTLSVTSGVECRLIIDPSNPTTNWLADCRPNGGAGSVAFSSVTSGTSTGTLLMGTGGSLGLTGTGTINANILNGVTLSGAAATGNCMVATSSSAADWGSCATLGFPATVTGGTTGHFTSFSASTTLAVNANLTDLSNTLTYAGTSGFLASLGPIEGGLSGGGVGQPFIFQEGTQPSSAANQDWCYASSTTHTPWCNRNNTAYAQLTFGPSASATSDFPSFGDTTGNTFVDSGIQATPTGLNTAISILPGCTTATYVYTPQGADCVAPSGGGGGASVDVLDYFGVSATAAGASSAGDTSAGGFVARYGGTYGHFFLYISTTDNSADTYNFGIYNSSGTLLCSSGAIAGSTFATGIGISPAIAFTSSCTLAQGQVYFFASSAITSNTVQLRQALNNFVTPFTKAQVATSSMPSSITAPTLAYQFSSPTSGTYFVLEP